MAEKLRRCGYIVGSRGEATLEEALKHHSEIKRSPRRSLRPHLFFEGIQVLTGVVEGLPSKKLLTPKVKAYIEFLKANPW